MQIGPYSFPNAVALAPMAGVTDRPFRQLCRRLGAGLAASEMITADTRLWGSRKTRQRLDHRGEPAPSRRQSWRKGRSVTPAMGASATGLGKR